MKTPLSRIYAAAVILTAVVYIVCFYCSYTYDLGPYRTRTIWRILCASMEVLCLTSVIVLMKSAFKKKRTVFSILAVAVSIEVHFFVRVIGDSLSNLWSLVYLSTILLPLICGLWSLYAIATDEK